MVHQVQVCVLGHATEKEIIAQGRKDFIEVNRFRPDSVDLFLHDGAIPHRHYLLLFYVIDEEAAAREQAEQIQGD